MLGIPQVYIDGENIKLPFKKAEALLYFMAIEKNATRDQLVNLFWADSIEEVSKKNLRNAIYIIKKTLDLEVFLSPKRSMITLNDTVDFELDVDGEIKVGKSGEFLDGLYLKNCDDFDLWLNSQRQFYEDRTIGLLRNKISEAVARNDYKSVEVYGKELLVLDQFDEDIYRILMQNYFNAGRFDKSIRVYEKLVDLLDEELSISPDVETVQLHNDILKKRTQIKIAKQQHDGIFFYGRKVELKVLSGNYINYVQGNPYNHTVIIGEAGVGKTELINSFTSQMDSKATYILRTHCYKATEGFILKSWDSIIEELGQIITNENIKLPVVVRQTIQSVFPAFLLDTDSAVGPKLSNAGMYEMKIIENALVELFSIVSLNRKIIIIVEDIHWTDKISLSLLERVILNDRVNMLMICTCRISYDDITEKFITKIGANVNLERLYLQRFNGEDTIEFAKHFLPEKMVTQSLLKNLYAETEGNSFFLTEVLNNIKNGENYKVISSKIQDVLKHRILNLSSEAQKLIQIASIYFDTFSIEGLIGISGKGEIEVLDTIEELLRKNILKEIMEPNGRLMFMFTHQKIREFVYGDLSLSKKKILHERVAKYFESKLRGVKMDRLLYPKLIIHYEGAQNNLKVLEFSIADLYVHLQSIHEVFPIVDHKEIIDHVNVFIDEYQVLKEFEKLEGLYEKVFNEMGETKYLLELKVSLIHMESRYFINNGLFDRGLEYVDELFECAKKIGEKSHELKALLVKIHYSINAHKMVLMTALITEAMAIAVGLDMAFEIALLKRLSGFNNVLIGKYDKGEALLQESIMLMGNLGDKNKYILNIAASYYYLGDSYKFRGDFTKALEYYQLAIELCNDYGIVGRLTIFYTSAGQTYLNMGNSGKANAYFDMALELYEMLDFPWRRSIAYGCKGLLLIQEKSYKRGLELLVKMDTVSEKQRNPYEIAIKYRIKAQVAKLVQDGKCKNSEIVKFINGISAEAYAQHGIKALNRFENCHEMKLLQELKNN